MAEVIYSKNRQSGNQIRWISVLKINFFLKNKKFARKVPKSAVETRSKT